MVRLLVYQPKNPVLRSPKRKLRENAHLIPETHSLGSRLGLPGVRFHSAHYQNSR